MDEKYIVILYWLSGNKTILDRMYFNDPIEAEEYATNFLMLFPSNLDGDIAYEAKVIKLKPPDIY